MNKSIKSILAMLHPEHKKHLDYAFEHGLPNQYVEYSPGHFVGVNIQNLPNFNIEQTAGFYASGTIEKEIIQFPRTG